MTIILTFGCKDLSSTSSNTLEPHYPFRLSFRHPDGYFGLPAGFLTSRTAIFPSERPSWRPGPPSFFLKRHLRFPGRHLRNPAAWIFIRAAIFLREASSCSEKPQS